MKWLANPERLSESLIDRGRSATMQLAMDEAMLQIADEVASAVDGAESSTTEDESPTTELMRVWEFDSPVVVLGRSSRSNEEVDRKFCENQQIPIERRASGGASVVGGPGCLMYTVLLSLVKRPSLRKIDQAHQFVMSRVLAAVQRQIPATELQGICDLTWQNRKFSGNSLRIAKQHLLYHGTLLYDFDLTLLAQCLDFAPRQPEYRAGRTHDRFVTNAPIDAERIANDLRVCFEAESVNDVADYHLVLERSQHLCHERYEQDSWRFRH